MIVEQTSITEKNRLFSEIDKRIQSVKRRNVSYQVTAHGKDCATIVISISGRQGIISKNMTLVHNGLGWVLYYNDKKAYLDGFGQIASIIKGIVTSTSTLVSKL